MRDGNRRETLKLAAAWGSQYGCSTDVLAKFEFLNENTAASFCADAQAYGDAWMEQGDAGWLVTVTFYTAPGPTEGGSMKVVDVVWALARMQDTKDSLDAAKMYVREKDLSGLTALDEHVQRAKKELDALSAHIRRVRGAHPGPTEKG